MKFAIRDDDLCFFTKPAELEKVYGRIWHQIPISFAAIPFANRRFKLLVEKQLPDKSSTMKFVRGMEQDSFWNEEFPLAENKELMSYLQTKNVHIMLHGYNHDFLSDGYEFETGNNLRSKAIIGRDYLQSLFGQKVSVFVPPNNSLSVRGVRAVAEADLDILIGYGYYPWERSLSYRSLKNFALLFSHYIKKQRKLSYPFPLVFADHQELACALLNGSSRLSNLKDAFRYVLSKQGNFCLAVHHWEFLLRPSVYKTFLRFLRFVDSYGSKIEYVTADKLFEQQ